MVPLPKEIELTDTEMFEVPKIYSNIISDVISIVINLLLLSLTAK